jgi:hypothetical protein
MDNSKIIARLELLEASASIILQEAATIRKALQPVQVKKSGLTDEQKAKLLAKKRKTQYRR